MKCAGEIIITSTDGFNPSSCHLYCIHEAGHNRPHYANYYVGHYRQTVLWNDQAIAIRDE